MRTVIAAVLGLLLAAAPAAAQDEKDLRPGLKEGAFKTPDGPAPAPSGDEGGKPAIPPATVVFALVAGIAVLLVVCYPSKR